MILIYSLYVCVCVFIYLFYLFIYLYLYIHPVFIIASYFGADAMSLLTLSYSVHWQLSFDTLRKFTAYVNGVIALKKPLKERKLFMVTKYNQEP